MEENQVIENVQTGFTEINARTSDKIFLLKSFINKYTKMEGGKLYAYFLYFQKALASVIHPSLRVRLKRIEHKR